MKTKLDLVINNVCLRGELDSTYHIGINEGKIGFHPSGVYYAGDKPTNFIKPLHYNAKYLVGGNTKKNAEIIIKILSNKGSGKEYFAKENTISHFP